MGLAAADTKGQASGRGRVGEDECEREEHWSSGCVGLQRVEAVGRRRERHEAVQHQVPDMGLALKRSAKKTRWIEVPEFPIWGSNP